MLLSKSSAVTIDTLNTKLRPLIEILQLNVNSVAVQTNRDMFFRIDDVSGGCYIPAQDVIVMNEHHTGQDGLVCSSDLVLIHELIHWTGHDSRIARERVVFAQHGMFNFNPTSYLEEELIACLGTILLFEYFSLDTKDAYLTLNWYLEKHGTIKHDFQKCKEEANKAALYIVSQFEKRKTA